jgi:hypothetical protein
MKLADCWRGVFFFGPESFFDPDGENILHWTVFVGDADANPVGQTYWPGTYAGAVRLAEEIARDRQLALINEADQA